MVGWGRAEGQSPSWAFTTKVDAGLRFTTTDSRRVASARPTQGKLAIATKPAELKRLSGTFRYNVRLRRCKCGRRVAGGVLIPVSLAVNMLSASDHTHRSRDLRRIRADVAGDVRWRKLDHPRTPPAGRRRLCLDDERRVRHAVRGGTGAPGPNILIVSLIGWQAAGLVGLLAATVATNGSH